MSEPIPVGSSKFLDLPVDIMLMILEELLLGTRKVVQICFKETDSRPRRLRLAANMALHPEILRTCKALKCLGLWVLYGFNGFCVSYGGDDSTTNTFSWTYSISIANFAMIKNISVTLPPLQRSFWTGEKRSTLEELRRAQSVAACARALQHLAQNGTGLENLTLKYPARSDIDGDDPNTLICQITLLRAIASIPRLKSLEFIGCKVPKLWLGYLHRTMHIPVSLDHCWVPRGNLSKAISDLSLELEKSRTYIVEERVTNAPKNFPDSVMRCVTNRVEKDLGMPRWTGDHVRVFKQSDNYNHRQNPARTASSSKRTQEVLIWAFWAEKELESGTYWPPVRYYERQREIERYKLDLLLRFWLELLHLGMIKRRT